MFNNNGETMDSPHKVGRPEISLRDVHKQSINIWQFD